MKLRNARALALIVFTGCLAAGSATDFDSADRIMADIEYLAADAREGRGVGTDGLDTAAAYVAAGFEAAGLHPGGDHGFLQRFVLDPSAPALAHAGIGAVEVANIVGVRPGTGALAGEVVVVGAHYDHLGRGGNGSLDPDSAGVIHNGADDNASGTATLMEVARLLRARSAPAARTIVFAAFTAEELGLLGSDYFVKHPSHDTDSMFAMVNLDMVGRLRDNRLAIFGTESAEEFPSLLDSVNASHGLDLATGGNGFGSSDHQSFFLAGIPVLHFFTGTHEDYHRTSDDADRIAGAGTARIARYVSDLTWVLATRGAELTFVEAGPARTVAPGSGARPYLGTIPDMTGSPGGVRLNGVTAGSPADEAGLQAGDVLIGIDDFEIADLFDMTDALNAHQPGDRVTLRVRRNGEVLEFPATLRARGE